MIGSKKIKCCLLLMGLLGLCSCGSPSSDLVESTIVALGQTEGVQIGEENSGQLVYESSMELKYAKHFSVDYYIGGYKMLTVKDGTKLLVVPKGKPVPQDLEEDVCIMQQPIENLYLVATAVMDMFHSLDAIDTIRLSGQKEGNWYIESANEAMERGKENVLPLCSERILLCDASKLGVRSTRFFAGLDVIDRIITDDAAEKTFLEKLASIGVLAE